jgi:hypothetical protein
MEGSLIGIASAASGGDILFLERCVEAGIEIRIVLPFSVARFVETSVRGAGSRNWETRFRSLWDALPPGSRLILDASQAENAYEYCNRHLISVALEVAEKFRLIALWDGKKEDPKPGGTASFVKLACLAGGHVALIDTKALLRKLHKVDPLVDRMNLAPQATG